MFKTMKNDNQLTLFNTLEFVKPLVPVAYGKHTHYFRGAEQICKCGITAAEFKRNRPQLRRSKGNDRRRK